MKWLRNNSTCSMRGLIMGCILIFIGSTLGYAHVVVFWNEDFPTVAGSPLARETLIKALNGTDPLFTNLDRLKDPAAFPLPISSFCPMGRPCQPIGRQNEIGLQYEPGPLTARENLLSWPGVEVS
jgi:hypothetical protein